MPRYPLPTADRPEVEALQELYRTQYNVELGFDEAKRFLEGLMQFIYLTEVDEALESVKSEMSSLHHDEDGL